MDRYHQCHKNFDQWQQEGKHFVCPIKANTKKTLIRDNEVNPCSVVFYDAIVLLGTPGVNQTQKELRGVGYRFMASITGLPPKKFVYIVMMITIHNIHTQYMKIQPDTTEL
ncbi:MAG: hypothetical protein ABIN18_29315 [Pseudomonadota bacterium]